MSSKRKADAAADGETDATKFLEDAQRAVDFTFTPTVVLPGDDVTDVVTKTTRRVKLGATCSCRSCCCCCCRCTHACDCYTRTLACRRRAQAIARRAHCVHECRRLALPSSESVLGRVQLQARTCSALCVDRQTRALHLVRLTVAHALVWMCLQYVASLDDGVIGVVTDRNAELYRVNIGAAYVDTSAVTLLDYGYRRTDRQTRWLVSQLERDTRCARVRRRDEAESPKPAHRLARVRAREQDEPRPRARDHVRRYARAWQSGSIDRQTD